jgi:hypothetical protein
MVSWSTSGTASGPNMSGNQTAGGNYQSQSAGGSKKVRATPFIRASAQHSESVGYDVTTALNATGATTLPDILVPAYGFLRGIILVVTTTGGTGTAAFGPDAPFNVLQNIVLQEPNGAQICNFPSGYDLFLANKYGGYQYANDPRSSPNQSFNLTGGNFSFTLRIPVEVDTRDALGSLPNQNSGALFRVKLNLANGATAAQGLFSTQPTTFPSVRIRAYAEEWDQPEASTNGVPNATVPPALNTTQYWTRQDFPVNAGTSNIRLTRMGNYLRNLIFVYRDSTQSRSANDANFPDPATIYYDTRPLDNVSRAMWLDRIYNRYGYGAQVGNTNSLAGTVLAVDTGSGRESGVWPLDFAHEFDGAVGWENRDLWLPTYSSTRFEIGGTWGGSGGTLSVLTNDVTIADNVWM